MVGSQVGMAHRGRLSLLCNLLNKPPGALFAQMDNAQSEYRVGDVKYHLGETATLSFAEVGYNLLMADACKMQGQEQLPEHRHVHLLMILPCICKCVHARTNLLGTSKCLNCYQLDPSWRT